MKRLRQGGAADPTPVAGPYLGAPEPRRRAMSSVVRPNLESRSSLMSLSQRRVVSSPDRPWPERVCAPAPTGLFGIRPDVSRCFVCGPSTAMIPTFLETGSRAAPATAQVARQFTAPVFVAARYDVITAERGLVTLVTSGVAAGLQAHARARSRALRLWESRDMVKRTMSRSFSQIMRSATSATWASRPASRLKRWKRSRHQ